MRASLKTSNQEWALQNDKDELIQCVKQSRAALENN